MRLLSITLLFLCAKSLFGQTNKTCIVDIADTQFEVVFSLVDFLEVSNELGLITDSFDYDSLALDSIYNSMSDTVNLYMLSFADGIDLNPPNLTYDNGLCGIDVGNLFLSSNIAIERLIDSNRAIFLYWDEELKFRKKKSVSRDKYTNERDTKYLTYHHKKYGTIMVIKGLKQWSEF